MTTHGTVSAYKKRGCRCEPCRAAMSDYGRELRRRQRERLGILGVDLRKNRPINARHGTHYCYKKLRCRCEPCRRANAVRMQRWLRRRRQPFWEAPRMPRPFPLAPVLAYGPKTHIARRLGVEPRQLYTWAQTGLTDRQADEIAVRLGCHPTELWPDWYDLDALGVSGTSRSSGTTV